MTTDELLELWRAREAVTRPYKAATERRDLKAFNLLAKLVPDTQPILCHAEHDQVWLSVELEYLAMGVTQEQVEELIECGVHLDEDTQGLFMFV